MALVIITYMSGKVAYQVEMDLITATLGDIRDGLKTAGINSGSALYKLGTIEEILGFDCTPLKQLFAQDSLTIQLQVLNQDISKHAEWVVRDKTFVDGSLLTDTDKQNRRVMMILVTKDGRNLTYASDALKADRDLVMAAVAQYGGSLQYAAKALCSDREIVLTAVAQYGLALHCAAKELQADREVVLTAVSKGRRSYLMSSFAWAAKTLQADRDFVLEVVGHEGRALIYATQELKSDPIILFSRYVSPTLAKGIDKGIRRIKRYYRGI